jgi:hypothetical protein
MKMAIFTLNIIHMAYSYHSPFFLIHLLNLEQEKGNYADFPDGIKAVASKMDNKNLIYNYFNH